MVLSDRTKGCCSSDLNEPLHPNHDQFAELDAHNSLPSLLAPLDQIRALPSATASEVKQKEQIFRRQFLPAQDRFEKTANLWCAEALEKGDH